MSSCFSVLYPRYKLFLNARKLQRISDNAVWYGVNSKCTQLEPRRGFPSCLCPAGPAASVQQTAREPRRGFNSCLRIFGVDYTALVITNTLFNSYHNHNDERCKRRVKEGVVGSHSHRLCMIGSRKKLM
ncbi:hypothetical protein Y032_0050g2028 [Ancylostoma ceylanicum]|uniref:Uncharacterized protein n=1 Tax=Ancylostoma ceylanicum TaxID=53326 RepID=A0A016U9P8_9BILA|nr:hypothetical protein Y032_0050g2028 [Ancylostoma ceylanicum]